jgi:exosortase N
MDDASFSVDQACMGLNMLAISMLMAVFMAAFHFRKATKKLSLISLSFIFLSTFLLNVGANFIRILMLVIFRIMPDHPMHDALGILVMVAYIFIPLHFLTRWTVHRFGKPLQRLNNPFSQVPSVKQIWTLYFISTLILALGIYMNLKRNNAIMSYANVTINTSKLEISEDNVFLNLQTKQIDECVTKIYNDGILIYIKPIPEFFSGEHSPLFCWQGGGYEFKRIRKAVVNEQTIYLAQIVNRQETLFTAWWYSNGEVNTVDQFDWRMRMMQGEPAFNLINVTCSSEQKLMSNLNDIFQRQIISINHKSL